MSTKHFLPSLLESKLANDPCCGNTFTPGYVLYTITDMNIGMSSTLFKGSVTFNKIRSSFTIKVITSYHKSVDLCNSSFSAKISSVALAIDWRGHHKGCLTCPSEGSNNYTFTHCWQGHTGMYMGGAGN